MCGVLACACAGGIAVSYTTTTGVVADMQGAA